MCVCMYVYVCMYVCVYIYIYIYIYESVCMYVYMCIYTCNYFAGSECKNIHTYMLAYMHDIHKYIHLCHSHTHTYMTFRTVVIDIL
jgi:hypothetical protein